MKKFKIFMIWFVAGAMLLCNFQLFRAHGFSNDGVAYAQDEWKKEFDDICSKTQDAMTMAAAELKTLVDRCDKLKPSIETLDETKKKVYLKRLQKCRDLFIFVLESQQSK